MVEARIVFDLSGQGQLPAGMHAFDQQGRQVRPRRVDGGGQPCRPGPDDGDVTHGGNLTQKAVGMHGAHFSHCGMIAWDMVEMQSRTALTFIVVLLGVLAAARLQAIEFSADYVKRVDGKTARAQIYVKGDRIRLEHQGGVLTDLGYAGVSIVRLDRQVVWLLLSKRRQYLTVPLRKDHVPPLTETMEGETARKVAREETLGKY